MTSPTEIIEGEAARSARLLAAVDADAAVPSCPGWNARDLLWHLAEVHEFWSAVLAEEARTGADAERLQAAKQPRPTGEGELDALLARRETATAALVEQLQARETSQRVWTWFPADQSVGFIRRMQVHEATIHRVDAEMTAGQAQISAIGEDTAADGLAHVVEVMWAAELDWVPEDAGIAPLAHLTLLPDTAPAIDVEILRWETEPSGGAPADSHLVARPLPESADAADLPQAQAACSARALYLWAWGRGQALQMLPEGPRTVGLTGDDEALHLVAELLEQGVQ